ncbi:MAG: large subunit ribosomal protein L9 [Candidatus Azotimanducaceae bacterium]|jgi:large subunit ribosomal protein L9
MEVILLENIANLGELGEKVSVKSGYGRNFLIPQRKAVPATKANLIDFEVRRAELQKLADEKLAVANARAEKVNALSITLTTKAGDEGKLFGSITVRDIAEAAVSRGVDIEKTEIQMPDGPLRQLGEYVIAVQLHSDVTAELKVGVIAET